MSIAEKLKKELTMVGLITFYFATWLFVLLFLKWLILAEYDIEFRGFSIVAVGCR